METNQKSELEIKTKYIENTNIPYITNEDIDLKKYPEHVLEANIDHLCLRLILYYQKVSPNFCYTYFWDTNDKYMKDDCDDYHSDTDDVYVHEVLRHQTHITKEDLDNCEVRLERIRQYRENEKRRMNENKN
jgi:hypothetical protein